MEKPVAHSSYKHSCTAAHQKRSQKQTNLGMTRVRLSSIAREKAATICARHRAVSTAQQAAQGWPQSGTHPSASLPQGLCRSCTNSPAGGGRMRWEDACHEGNVFYRVATITGTGGCM